jgi:hypothetical protein
VHMLTLEAELHGIELDGHGAGAGAGGDRQLLVIGVVDTWTAMSHAGGCAMAVAVDVAALEKK